MSTFTPAVYRDNTHTAIVIDRTDTHFLYVPLASLKIEKISHKDFASEWVAYPEYPVRRAAEVYLRAGDYRQIPAQTREHLNRIVADPATEYQVFESSSTIIKGTATMAKSPATRNGMSSVKEALAPKGKPVKATAPAVDAKPKGKPATTPAEALKKGTPVVKTDGKPVTAATKGKPAPASPVGKPAPAAPVGKPAPAVKVKPAAAAAGDKPARNRIPDDVKYKVVDTSRVKRGFLAEFVAKAQTLKVFTREKLEAEFSERGGDTRTYFPYCVGKAIFDKA
jgi:hypothetical protein